MERHGTTRFTNAQYLMNSMAPRCMPTSSIVTARPQHLKRPGSPLAYATIWWGERRVTISCMLQSYTSLNLSELAYLGTSISMHGETL